MEGPKFPALWMLTGLAMSMYVRVFSADLCHRGYLLYTPRYGPDVCLECFPGQFMPLRLHTHRQCYLCTEIQDPHLEILDSPCNRTHDTGIYCIDGYYRTQPSYPDVRGQCQKCTRCQYAKRPCQKFSDTICCPGDKYDVYINKTGQPECVPLCGYGQFLDSDTHQCLPCLENTYMDEDKHIYIGYCKNCPVPQSKHEKVLRVCNSTHATVIGCVDGFYRQRNTEGLSVCVACRKCSGGTDGNMYAGRACNQSHDSVCCPGPDMSVEDTLEGPVCVSRTTTSTDNGTPRSQPNTTVPLFVCGENEYLHINGSTHSATCQPCPQGTYVDSKEHTRSTCESCEEFSPVEFCPPDTEEHGSRDNESLTFGGAVGTTLTGIVIVAAVAFILSLLWNKHLRLRCKARDAIVDAEAVPLLAQMQKGGPWSRQRTISEDSTDSMMDLLHDSKTLIPAGDFCLTHLQHHYSNDVMVDMIRLQIDLTVLVWVQGSSQNRPAHFPDTDKPYPFSGDKFRTVEHTGSGWLERVKMYKDQRCPCTTCQQSAQPVKSWGEIVICTAARVVFDITEGRKSRCSFFYDTPDTDPRVCPSVDGAMKVLSDPNRDWCYMTFVTHDNDLMKKLEEKYNRYHRIRREVKNRYGVTNDEVRPEKLMKRFAELEQELMSSSTRLDNISMKAICNSDHLYTSLSGLGDVFGVTLKDNDKEEQLHKIISELRAVIAREQARVKCQSNTSCHDDDPVLHEKYWEMTGKWEEIDRFIQRLPVRVDGSNIKEGKEDHYKPRYDPARSFTVVISHPYGRSKQISLGYATGLKVSDHYSWYTYTNLLVSGCEGARVFILGRTRRSDHGHCKGDSQESKTGAWSDLIPVIADFSAGPVDH